MTGNTFDRRGARDLRQAGNLLELIQRQVDALAGEIAFAFPGDEHGPGAGGAQDTTPPEDFTLTYGDLDREARLRAPAIAALQKYDEPILLLLPPGPDYVIALFACLYADRIAVPAPPPVMDRNLDRLRSIVLDTGAARALVSGSQQERFARRFKEHPGLETLAWCSLDELARTGAAYQPPRPTKERVALLQYTSGSTGEPRGVMLTHENLLSNATAIHVRFRTDENTSGVFWLPPHHDMGLIGGILHPVFIGGRSFLMSPLDFLKNPLRWLTEISNRRASISGAPNFAYDLCVTRRTAEAVARLDLSHWRLAFCGAEPVRPATLDRFATAFEPAGFRRRSFAPCYGLAEATLLVSGAESDAEPRVGRFERRALEAGRARSLAADDSPRSLDAGGLARAHSASADVLQLMALGRPAGPEVLVVDPELRKRKAEGETGEIWVRGPAVSPGYWRRPDQTGAVFGARLHDADAAMDRDADGQSDATTSGVARDGYLRTGDLGFFHEGQLFLYGRRKELIIMRGRNIAPADLEQSAVELLAELRALDTSGTAAAKRSGRRGIEKTCAAFGLDAGDGDQIHLLVESDDVAGSAVATAEQRRKIESLRSGLVARFGLPVQKIILIRSGAIPRTTSGKVQRYLCRERYLRGELPVLAEG